MKGMVSVIIPLFNRENLITETLQSVREQTYSNFECIVVDDGSTDQSLAAAKAFAEGDNRFIIVPRSTMTKGACACRNEGIEKASGEYLMFLDSDDLLSSTCLEERVQRFQKNPKDNFIVNQIGLFDHNTYLVTSLWSSLNHRDDLKAFLYSEGWQTSSTFFKTSFVKKYRFDENALSWQDVDFHLRILLDRPVYTKFPDTQPDVFMRHSGLERISNTNVYFNRIQARLRLYLKLEGILEDKGNQEYLYPFLMYHFKFVEIAALVLPFQEFRQLFEIWMGSKTYLTKRGYFFRLYFHMQASLKRVGLRILCSVFYRIIRWFISVSLLSADHRKSMLREPIQLPKPTR
jgi:glycosyltransferase involved in cell wall biosynthesis